MAFINCDLSIKNHRMDFALFEKFPASWEYDEGIGVYQIREVAGTISLDGIGQQLSFTGIVQFYLKEIRQIRFEGHIASQNGHGVRL